MIRCAYCHGDAGPGSTECSRCRTILHRDCFEIHGSCPTLGCGAPPPRKNSRRPLGLSALVLLGAVVALTIPLAASAGHAPIDASPLPALTAPSSDADRVAPVTTPARLPVVWAEAPEPVGGHQASVVRPRFADRSGEFGAWARFGAGAFVEFEVKTPGSRRIVRTTVTAVRDDAVTLETDEVVLLEGERSESHRAKREVPAVGEGKAGDDEPSRFRRLSDVAWPAEEDEDLAVDGKSVRCRRSMYGEEGSLPMQSTTLLWCSDEVPGGLCRAQTRRAMDPEWPVTVTLLRFSVGSPR